MSKSELRASQVLTTFGPGALMDLPETSIIIGGLDHWYYSGTKDPNIEEPRLIAKIRARLDNPHLTLRKPPANEDDQPGRTSGITGWMFPQWFLVQETIEASGGTRRRLVHKDRLQNGKFRDSGNNYEVVPVRFVRACESGHIDDLDWTGYAHHYGRRCGGQLYLEESGTTGQIADIKICCDCGAFRPLGEAARKATKTLGRCTGQRPWLGAHAAEACDCWSRLLTRSASNAYCHRSLQKEPPKVETRGSKSPTPLSTGISGHYGLRVFKRLLLFQWFSVRLSPPSPLCVLRWRGGVPDGGRAVAGRSAAVGR